MRMRAKFIQSLAGIALAVLLLSYVGTAVLPAGASHRGATAASEPGSSASASISNSWKPLWINLEFSRLPPPRFGFSFTLNPLNRLGLLFGGIGSSEELDDLWITDGRQWLPFQTPHSPGRRAFANLVYAVGMQGAVLFGGSYQQTLLGDTWYFNGVDWVQVQSQVSPMPRSGASMAYDAGRNEVVLFGGVVDSGQVIESSSNETWVWNGVNWHQLPTGPSGRWGAQMVYDQSRQYILLYGGASGGALLNDTWIWNGLSWVELHPIHTSGGRADFGMAFDENRQQVVIFGGQVSGGIANDTWAWDGQDWIELPALQAPPVELTGGVQLAYLPELQTVTAFGDFRKKVAFPDDSFGVVEYSSMWSLNYQRPYYLPLVDR